MVLTSDELGSSSGINEDYEYGKPGKADKGSTMGSQSDGKATSAGTKIGMVDIHDAQAHVPHDKRLRKPDKPRPCPRCESMDTKFCYFNNYNVNQPRHFCRKCQRYWTAGGSLRNMPVGAGRRKSKHAASHQKHVIMPDMAAVRIDGGDVAHGRITGNHSKVGPSQPQCHLLPLEVGSFTAMDSPSSGIMLSFGHQSPLCESTAATSLSMQRGATIEHQGSLNGQSALPAYGDMTVDSENGWSVDCKKRIITPSNRCHETSSAPAKFHSTDTSAAGSSVAAIQWSQKNDHVHSTVSELANKANTEADAHALQETGVGSYACSGPGHHFNLAMKNPSAVAAVSLPAPNCWPWNGAPGGMWGSFPWPCMPPTMCPTMWGSPPFNWTSAWSMPWGPAAAAGAVVAAAAAATASSTARKHRLESSQVGSGAEGCLWVPKTLRINDPDEAARSSIWTTLGLGDGPGSLAMGRVVTKAFRCKSETKDGDESTTQSRHSNPAAMSRSMAFNENN